MDAAEQQRRWQTADDHRRAAYKLFDEGLFQASASCSYYACYQAMWVAVGDPPKGQWRHGGLMQHFCVGRWALGDAHTFTDQLSAPLQATGQTL
jgi:uncharacterized protein (UPF0332 family)